ncbi:HAD-IB family phosphatase [Flagellimonas olearia]|uniref:HAD-IB family hydrolase n=1 Tax=Flagellimonas olearia TaxID=552546 RepID=A0A444VKX8_9FLAO|nr:HAD-IB family phosphatase [Allomuricauda olearia]RYC51419.1 hypothetical protein DN53_14580 [Allomuricauda olearia]
MEDTNTNSNHIAVFDLDGTITSKDTYLEFIKYVNGTFRFYLGLVALSPYVILFYLGIIKNQRLKELFFSYYLSNHGYKEIEKKGQEFSEKVLPSLCRESASIVLSWHTVKKHDIMILTASSGLWLKKWCDSKGYILIGTEFERTDDRFTGSIDGLNCYGNQKRSLLENYLKGKKYSYTYGYGDRASDRYFLELVDEPYLMALTPKNVTEYWNKQ